MLTAVASAPREIDRELWFSALLGDGDLSESSEGSPSERSLTCVYVAIEFGLEVGQPRWATDFSSDEELRDFCTGYLEGARMDEVWLADEEAHFSMFPLGVLSGEFDLVGEERADGTVIQDPSELIEKYRTELPQILQDLHDYWIYRDVTDRPEPAVSAKVGRNEPCPCGSGLKFKRCCWRT